MFELRVHVESQQQGHTRRWRARVASAAGSSRWVTVPQLLTAGGRSIPPAAAASWADFMAHCAPNDAWRPPLAVLKEVGATVWSQLLATADFPAQLERARERAGGAPIRVALVLEDDGGDELDAALFDCPFELAYRSEPGNFIFNTTTLPAVRIVSGPDERNVVLGAGARVALVTAHADSKPEPTHKQLVQHTDGLEGVVRACGWSPVVVQDATPESVERLLCQPLDVLYIACHGEDDPARSGRLVLRGGDLTGERLGTLLADRTGLRLDPVQLVVLVACSSATPRIRRWSAGMAEWVARCGRALAAVGFRGEVSVENALPFGERLLRHLCEGTSLEQAFAAARGSIPDPEWALPLLYARLHDRSPAPPPRPPLARPPAPDLPRLNAPLPLTVKSYFTGRDRERAELRTLLEDSKTAVLTSIEGQGGIGKSELAAILASDFRAAGREVVWLEQPSRDRRTSLVTLLRARTPNLQVPPERSNEDLVKDLRRDLGPYEGMLVLDDVEEPGDIVDLRPGAGWSVLVTTRRPDLAPGARRLELAPLSPGEAVTLLSRLAWGPDEPPAEHRVAAEALVETLGRVPLHIELAGATMRTALIPPAEYRSLLLENKGPAQPDLSRVRDVLFERVLSQLQPGDRDVLLSLGLFPSSGIRAEHIAMGFGGTEPRITRLLERLTRRRVVVFSAETQRYGLHALVRAAARAQAKSTVGMWDRLRGVVATALGRVAEWLTKPIGRQTDHALVRWSVVSDMFATMTWEDWDAASPGASTLAQTIASIDMFRASFMTPRARVLALEHALSLAGGDRLAAASVLFMTGKLRLRLGDVQGAQRDLDGSLSHACALGHRSAQAEALQARSELRIRNGDNAGAQSDLAESLALQLGMNNKTGAARALLGLGQLRGRSGDTAGAARDFDAALLLYIDTRDRLGQATVLKSRGDDHRLREDFDGALANYDQALGHFRAVANDHGEAQILHRRGIVRWHQGDGLGADRDFQGALDIFSKHEDCQEMANVLVARGQLLMKSGDLDGAASCFDASHSYAVQVGDRLAQANSLAGRAQVARRSGSLRAALQLLGRAESLYRMTGVALGLSNTLAEAASIHARLGEPLPARHLATEAHALALRCGNPYALRLAASITDRLEPPPTTARPQNPHPPAS